MGARLLVMFSVLVVELGIGIALILAVNSNYPYRLDEGGVALIVLICAATIVSWLLTIAFFMRKSARTTATRIVDNARLEAATILANAADRAAILCSLEGGKCKQCGNPRTGKFCPKCGTTGEPAPTSA